VADRQATSENELLDPFFGPVAHHLGWAPPIRYLLRRQRILRLLHKGSLGDIVEVGSGAGALLCELSRYARSAVGIETSERALRISRTLAGTVAADVRFVERPGPDWDGRKDLVCAFDVLEHIENEDVELATWLSWLKAGGRVCLSVPAHRARWGAGDEWAGHWRRYDRSDLVALLSRHNLDVEHLESYGFPVANLTERIGQRSYRKMLRQRGDSISPPEATAESGVERSRYLRLFQHMDSLPGRFGLRLGFMAQAMTSRLDWGSGYLVMARPR